MNNDLSLDIAQATGIKTTTPDKVATARDRADYPGLGAARRRNGLALALSVCLHVVALLLLTVVAARTLKENTGPALFSLAIITVPAERSGPPIVELASPVARNTVISKPNRPAAQLASSTSRPAEQTEQPPAPKPAAFKSTEATAEASPPAQPTAITVNPVPAPVAAVNKNEQAAAQVMALESGTGPITQTVAQTTLGIPAKASGQAQTAEINQPPVIEARPLYRVNPAPDYPGQARRRQLEGLALLDVLVTEQGRPADVRIVTSSGHDLLDSAALAAVRNWLFEPGQRGGSAVAMRVRVPVRFALK